MAESELCIDYEVDSNEEDDSALGSEGVEMKPWRRFEFHTTQHFLLFMCCHS